MASVDEIFWEAPGPGAFLETLTGDLNEGYSVIVCIPEHAAPGLLAAVEKRVRKMDLFRTVPLDLSDSTPAESPLLAIRRALGGPVTAAGIDEAHELARDVACRGRLFWVEGLSEASWQCWSPFLEEYAQVARAASDFRLPRLAAVLRGRLAMRPPPGDVGLTVRTWRGIVGILDMLVLAARLIPDDDEPSLQKRIRIWIAAELASADPVLAARLCRCDMRELLYPREILANFARSRQWTHLPSNFDEQWAAGMADQIDGILVVHAAALVLNGSRDELKRRIWRAEVAVLFPLIEEHRARYLRKFDASLRVPFKTQHGQIDSKHDLEISHIFAQLRQSGAAGREKPLLEMLSRVRNALAHLEIVDESVLSNLISVSAMRADGQ